MTEQRTTESIEEVLNSRGLNYGEFSNTAKIAQDFFKILEQSPAYKSNKLTDVHKEGIRMILHKLARTLNGDPMYADTYTDIAGYAKLIENHISDINRLKEKDVDMDSNS